MDRLEELIFYYKNQNCDTVLIRKLLEDAVFLENELEKLKRLPFLRIDPKNPERQKATPAAKQYKEFLQQYVNIIKALDKGAKNDGETEESPLRKWFRSHSD